MRRLTWFSVGAATGVYGILKARRAAQSLTPQGLRARMTAVGAGMRVFSSEVAAGMADREGRLRADAVPASSQDATAPVREIEQTPPPRHRRSDAGEDTGTDGHR